VIRGKRDADFWTATLVVRAVSVRAIVLDTLRARRWTHLPPEFFAEAEGEDMIAPASVRKT
jgi:hypothetical protein